MIIKLRLDSAEDRDMEAMAMVAKSVIKARKVLVVTGAGVSCNAGIPDFRSSDGLYNMVKHQYPDVVVKGKDLFDTVLFSSPESTSVFFTFMASLRKCIVEAKSTTTHNFIKHLKDKKRLLRCYTQNIDGLETQEGLNLGVGEGWKKLDVVQLHGDIHELKCMQCLTKYPWDEEKEDLLHQGNLVPCPSCIDIQEGRLKAGKRETGVGFLRPNIVLYGEEHPDGEVIGRCTTSDFKVGPDCLIISGTSLKVTGIRKLVKEAAKRVHEKGGLVLFVNRTEVCQSYWKDVIDYHIECDSDDWVNDLKLRQPAFFATTPPVLKQAKLPNYPAQKNVSKPKKSVKQEFKVELDVDISSLLSPPRTPKSEDDGEVNSSDNEALSKTEFPTVDTIPVKQQTSQPFILTPMSSFSAEDENTENENIMFTPTKADRVIQRVKVEDSLEKGLVSDVEFSSTSIQVDEISVPTVAVSSKKSMPNANKKPVKEISKKTIRKTARLKKPAASKFELPLTTPLPSTTPLVQSHSYNPTDLISHARVLLNFKYNRSEFTGPSIPLPFYSHNPDNVPYVHPINSSIQTPYIDSFYPYASNNELESKSNHFLTPSPRYYADSDSRNSHQVSSRSHEYLDANSRPIYVPPTASDFSPISVSDYLR